MVLLDVVYTKVYTNSNPRNKFQYILSLKPQNIDNIFLGSSRTANHIVTQNVQLLSGESALNLGIEGAVFEDNLLQLKLLIDKHIKIKRVFMQVDNLYENDGVSNIANAEALPFIKNLIIKEHLKSQLEDFPAKYYIPFYRYMVTEHKIGLREFFFTIINKKPRVDLKDGYTPKYGKNKLVTSKLPNKIKQKNETLNKMFQICKANSIKLIYFVAPICSKTEGINYIDKLKIKLPELKDFSRSLGDDYFYNCAHLNDEGAKVFTESLTQECITLKK
jgi:hypothetical protein